MIEPFIIRAIAAGVGIAIITGVIGCFVVWRRLAYFGDSLAHNALLGIALGITTGINTNISTIITSFIFAILLLWLQNQRTLATDTLLGILAHLALSVGMITVSVLKQRINLHTYLFGDILTVTNSNLLWIYGGGLIVLSILLFNWSALVLATINEELARAENVSVTFSQLLLMLLMATVIAVSIQIVGILLITSMLIIPAATARQITKSPESMAATSALLSIISVIGGIFASIKFNIPSVPTIVVTSASVFIVLCIAKILLSYSRGKQKTI